MKLKHFAIAAFIVPASLQAASITAAGIDTLTPTLNGAGDVADLDTNGSGGDGFVVFNTLPPGGNSSGGLWNDNIISSLPAYVTALDGSTSVSSGGWANYDGVTVGGNTHNTGGINNPSAGGTELASFTFQLTGSVPASITLGLLTDNSDNVAWASSNVRIEGPGAITANQSPPLDGASDLVKFNIDGGVAGETYTVYGTSNGSGSLFGAATFDSTTIPEPSSIGLLVLGGLAGLRRRRR